MSNSISFLMSRLSLKLVVKIFSIFIPKRQISRAEAWTPKPTLYLGHLRQFYTSKQMAHTTEHTPGSKYIVFIMLNNNIFLYSRKYNHLVVLWAHGLHIHCSSLLTDIIQYYWFVPRFSGPHYRANPREQIHSFIVLNILLYLRNITTRLNG